MIPQRDTLDQLRADIIEYLKVNLDGVLIGLKLEQDWSVYDHAVKVYTNEVDKTVQALQKCEYFSEIEEVLDEYVYDNVELYDDIEDWASLFDVMYYRH
jgi:hypothetical protein